MTLRRIRVMSTLHQPPHGWSLLLRPKLTSSSLCCGSWSSRQSYSSQTPTEGRKRVVGILGGGISGLSVAYYITKLYGGSVRTVLFEDSDSVGGWVRTAKGDKGGVFEMGPRTIRPFGVRGLNTLDLVEDIGLDKEVLYVERSHPVAKDRFIYVKPGLVKLPSDYSVLFRKTKPFSRPLVFAVLKDIFTRRKTLADDTIYNFVSRRFGTEIADYLTDPLIRGVCAGDSKRVSVKFLMKELFELEQKHGSVVVGSIKERMSKKKQQCKMGEDGPVGFSKIASSSMLGNWAVWGLDNGGLETLPTGIYNWVRDRGGDFKLGTRVIRLEENRGRVTVRFANRGGRDDTVECDHVVSAVGSFALSRILRESGSSVVAERDSVIEQLEQIEYADLRVTGFGFDGNVLQYPGFGFLVPSKENLGGLLGVVFDTNCFPQGGDTVITAMSRLGEDVESLQTRVGEILGITQKPREVVSRVLKSCIPQYGVGHHDRVARITAATGGSLSLCGAWVDGVSINDCVFRGKVVAKGLGEKLRISESSEGVDNDSFSRTAASN